MNFYRKHLSLFIQGSYDVFTNEMIDEFNDYSWS